MLRVKAVVEEQMVELGEKKRQVEAAINNRGLFCIPIDWTI